MGEGAIGSVIAPHLKKRFYNCMGLNDPNTYNFTGSHPVATHTHYVGQAWLNINEINYFSNSLVK
jgi:hypothetical protein